jgi:thiamine kinase-like enzyme
MAASEARFYRGIAPLLPAGLTARCLLSEDDGESSTLVLEDLAATHARLMTPVPSFGEAAAFVDALADLHAAGLRQPSAREVWRTAGLDMGRPAADDRLGARKPYLGAFAGAFPELDAWGRQLFAAIAQSAGGLLAGAGPETFLHGDAHYWNGLYSPAGAAIIDWESACLGPGVVDLAHALALNLPPGVSEQWEAALLDTYVERLRSGGVETSLDEVSTAYRFGVLHATTVLVGRWFGGEDANAISRWLDYVMATAKRLRVDELL